MFNIFLVRYNNKNMVRIEIRLNYFTQGSDLNLARVYTDQNKLNFSETIENHKKILNSAISQLDKINLVYSENKPDYINIKGDNHRILLDAPNDFIRDLEKHGIVESNDYVNSENMNYVENINYELGSDFMINP